MLSQVICIWLPNWPCQRLHVIHPTELNQQPFVLQARDPRRGWRVMASDSLAREHRIYPGMSISEATALLPTVRLLEYDPQEDLAGLLELAYEAWQFSPTVGLEKLDAQIWAGRSLHQPQAFFLEANGLTHLFDGPESMLLMIHDWLCSKGYVACLAMAPSIGSAWALANYGHRSQATKRLLQQRTPTQNNPNSFSSPSSGESELIKMLNTPQDGPLIQQDEGFKGLQSDTNISSLAPGFAGERVGVRGQSSQAIRPLTPHPLSPRTGRGGEKLLVGSHYLALEHFHQAGAKGEEAVSLVTHSDLATHTNSLPIEALRLDPKTTSTLHQLGIRTLDSLLKLPRTGLANRLGEELLQRIDATCHGQLEVLHELKEQMLCSVEMKLEYPTHQRTTLEEILRRLTQQLCSQLRQHGHGALRIDACLRAEQGPAYLLSLGLYRATADQEHLLPLLLGQLESELFQPPRRKKSPLNTRPTTIYSSTKTETLSSGCVVKENAPTMSGKAFASYRSRSRNITAVTLTATLTNPLVWKQVELFDTESQHYRNTIARHIDSVASRLGRRQVVAPQLQRHPQPELACQWRPLTGQRLDGQPQSTRRKLARAPRKANKGSIEFETQADSRNPMSAVRSTESTNASSFSSERLSPSQLGRHGEAIAQTRIAPSPDDPMRRPLHLYPSPQAIEIQSLDTQGVPSQFRLDRETYLVQEYWGPERIESGWWDAAHHRRDYYRVATDRGPWFWLYRDLHQKRWFLHGVF